jgi:hypothetical protein
MHMCIGNKLLDAEFACFTLTDVDYDLSICPITSLLWFFQNAIYSVVIRVILENLKISNLYRRGQRILKFLDYFSK